MRRLRQFGLPRELQRMSAEHSDSLRRLHFVRGFTAERRTRGREQCAQTCSHKRQYRNNHAADGTPASPSLSGQVERSKNQFRKRSPGAVVGQALPPANARLDQELQAKAPAPPFFMIFRGRRPVQQIEKPPASRNGGLGGCKLSMPHLFMKFRGGTPFQQATKAWRPTIALGAVGTRNRAIHGIRQRPVARSRWWGFVVAFARRQFRGARSNTGRADHRVMTRLSRPTRGDFLRTVRICFRPVG